MFLKNQFATDLGPRVSAQVKYPSIVRHFVAAAQPSDNKQCRLLPPEGRDALGSPDPCRKETAHTAPCLQRGGGGGGGGG